jgi:hypothetical protein
MVSKTERDALTEEYFSLKKANPEEFAKMNFEFMGESKVEKGEWKKGEFAWQEEKSPKGSRWYSVNGNDIYYTYSNPGSDNTEGQSKSFFYTQTKETPVGIGKRVYISIKIPQYENSVVR